MLFYEKQRLRNIQEILILSLAKPKQTMTTVLVTTSTKLGSSQEEEITDQTI